MLAMQQGYLTINLFQSIFLLHNETCLLYTSGGEDFSEYTKYAPAAFFSLGVGGQWPGHSDHYEADEDAFETGVAFYVQVALDALEKLSK